MYTDLLYTGGNGGRYPEISIASTGVPGLTAVLSSGTLGTGNGQLRFAIRGVPTRSGTASFAVAIGGKSCTVRRLVGTAISTLNCTSATHYGTLAAGTEAQEVLSEVGYTGGNGSRYEDQSFNSIGVIGLTATLRAGTLASGAGSLSFVITGTPASRGTASFTISVGGRGCTLRRTVLSAPLPSGIAEPELPGTAEGSTDGELPEAGTVRIGKGQSNPGEQFDVYPNPTDGLANIRVQFVEPGEMRRVRILDATGRQIGALDEIVPGEYRFDLSRYPSGLYYFVLFDGSGRVVGNRQMVRR